MPPTPASMLRTKRSWPGTSTKPMRIGSPAGPVQIEIGKADIDGDAAPLLFFQAIGVDAGERAHQGALAVVDVPGGADDDSLHRQQCTEPFVELLRREK